MNKQSETYNIVFIVIEADNSTIFEGFPPICLFAIELEKRVPDS